MRRLGLLCRRQIKSYRRPLVGESSFSWQTLIISKTKTWRAERETPNGKLKFGKSARRMPLRLLEGFQLSFRIFR
uniref:Uncharacterized protein n=1 Tax=Daphnia magna TaxID=35525 RepID=A0A0P4YPT0_9CRUS